MSNFSAIPGREQVTFNEMIMRSTLYQHAYLDLSGSSALKQQSGGNYVTPLGHIILFPSKPVIALSSYYFVISGEATHTNFIVFIWSYRDSNPRSFALKASTLTATPQRWLLTFNEMMMISVFH